MPRSARRSCSQPLLLGLYRLGSLDPGTGHQHPGRQGDPAELRRQQHPRPAQPVLRRRARPDRDLRARDHAVHHGVDHPAAAAGGRSVAGEALQGGRGRAGAHHPVHALPDGRARVRPVDRLRVPVPQLREPGRRQPDPELQSGQGLPDRDVPHGRDRAAHVDGRADHPARHRQRDLAADLRVDRLADPERPELLVVEPQSGVQGDHAVHRDRCRRSRRVRAGGPAAHPDPIRQTGHRPAHDPGRPDLPAAARQHGRRHPGDLRRQRDGDPADGRSADRAEPRRASVRTSTTSSRPAAGTTCSASAC